MTKPRFARLVLLSAFVQTVTFGTLLFVPAETLNWPRAWIFIAVDVAATVVMMVALFASGERDALLAERRKSTIQKDQPLADKIVVTAFLSTFCADIVFIPLDVFRFRLLPRPSVLIASIGLAVFLVGWLLMSLALKQNAFAAPVVKNQAERKQVTVDTGVYAVVRHPMYSGFVALSIGMSLWLESYTAAIAALIPIALLMVRILVEERFLKRELGGYEAYTRKVRYRLIPLVW
jgi:protein-S-isoprenylcysteine O-methyltransferase Ste14